MPLGLPKWLIITILAFLLIKSFKKGKLTKILLLSTIVLLFKGTFKSSLKTTVLF